MKCVVTFSVECYTTVASVGEQNIKMFEVIILCPGSKVTYEITNLRACAVAYRLCPLLRVSIAWIVWKKQREARSIRIIFQSSRRSHISGQGRGTSTFSVDSWSPVRGERVCVSVSLSAYAWVCVYVCICTHMCVGEYGHVWVWLHDRISGCISQNVNKHTLHWHPWVSSHKLRVNTFYLRATHLKTHLCLASLPLASHPYLYYISPLFSYSSIPSTLPFRSSS